MRRLLLPFAALLLCAACGIPSTSVREYGKVASPVTAEPSPSVSQGAYKYSLWFWNSSGNSPRLVPEVRYTDTKPTAELIYEQLVAGPQQNASGNVYSELNGFPAKLLPRLETDAGDTIRIAVPWAKVNDQARAQLYCSLSAQALGISAPAGNQDVLGIYSENDQQPNWNNCYQWAGNGAPLPGSAGSVSSPSP